MDGFDSCRLGRRRGRGRLGRWLICVQTCKRTSRHGLHTTPACKAPPGVAGAAAGRLTVPQALALHEVRHMGRRGRGHGRNLLLRRLLVRASLLRVVPLQRKKATCFLLSRCLHGASVGPTEVCRSPCTFPCGRVGSGATLKIGTPDELSASHSPSPVPPPCLPWP